MKNSLAHAHSVLGLEIGTANTRGFLFDVVEDSYRLIASNVVPSTHLEPVFDTGEAIYEVITRIQEVTGRALLDRHGGLIIPSQSTGEGVDLFLITTSCAPAQKIVAVGLLNEVSLESAKKLAYTTYGRLVDAIGINDRRPLNVQMDALLAANPDLILFAGGTDNGASRSLVRTADMICSVLGIMPRTHRPQVLYCGNQALNDTLQDAFERYTSVRVAPNIRPSLEDEILDPAAIEMNAMVMERLYEKVSGLARVSPLCSTPPQLSNQAFHNVIKFLGRQYDPGKGVLGLDIGATYSVAAYANDRFSALNTFNLGLGGGIEELLVRTPVNEISRWLKDSVTDSEVSDYLWNRSLYPLTVASTPVELEIELAAVRQLLRLMMRDLSLRDVLPSSRFEPILLSGSTINRAVTPVQSLLVILDGIQPLGISPLILDKHGILPILGAAAGINPLLGVQLLESTAFTNLATVVNVVGKTHMGNTLLNARLDYADGNFIEAEVKQGSIVALPLPPGASGLLHMRPVRRVEIEEVAVGSEPVKVMGGVCGVVLDARGRPIKLPDDAERRHDLYQEWEFMLGAK